MIYDADPIGDGDVQIGAPVDAPACGDSELLRWYEDARSRNDPVLFTVIRL